MKGLLVFIQGQDCTNYGVTSGKHKALLIGDGIPEIFSQSDDTPTLRLVYDLTPCGAQVGRLMVAKPDWLKRIGQPVKDFDYTAQHRIVRALAVPFDQDSGVLNNAGMYGGHEISTSDSRFPFTGPLPVHDRFE